MKVSIMQPTYLPWTGYFKMILDSDLFIFLDDVQFETRCFQSRNKILVNKLPKLISVPVNRKNKFDQLINEVQINYDTDWVNKHLRTIYLNYKNHPFFDEIYIIIKDILEKNEKKLVDLNCSLIKNICAYIGIKTKFEYSSSFKIKQKKTQKILGLLKATGGSFYLTPERTKDYLGKGELLKSQNIEISFINYICKKYNQKNLREFQSHLSIIDLLFNFGKNSKNLL